jgi:hypothetical protein
MGWHRKHVSRSASRKSFGKNAVRTHKSNVSARPMRGGIRL